MARNSVKPMPARSPEVRENQLINLAMDLAEKKLRDGTASSQIITTFLNLATTKYQLENDKLRADLRVADAKIKVMENQEDSASKYAEALAAFKSYQGAPSGDDYDEEDDF